MAYFYASVAGSREFSDSRVAYRCNLCTDSTWNYKFKYRNESLIQSGGTEYQELKNHLDAFETALFGPDFKDPEVGYRSFIDVASFVDWYIIQEIAKSVDAKWYSSIFFNYVPGKKIKMGPLWDFDLSFGNCAYPEWNFYDSYEIEGYHIKKNPWWIRLFEDPYFESLVKNRFQLL